MARKKKTPVKSKAGAISGVVHDAEFDELDAAMIDTKPDGVVLGEVAEAVDALDDTHDDIIETAEVTPKTEDALKDEAPSDGADDAQPVPDNAQIPAAQQSPAQQGSGFLGPLLGGALAALIGFGGAVYFKAAEWPIFGQGSDLEAKITSQSQEIADLNAALDAAQAKDAEALSALNARIDALPKLDGTALLPAELQAKLEAQKAQMHDLQQNLDKMNALTQGQIASAQAQQETAAQAEARAKARGALNALRTALDTGASFADTLPSIAAAADIPEALNAFADTGVLSASSLEVQFADAARTALSASLKATAGDAPTDRIKLFLRDQLGARSLIPRDGDDADAILSRTEAAVKFGDLDGALNTIDALPDAGKAELQAWSTAAAARRDALAAFDSLSNALSAN